jgi:hypothetical protein
LNDQKSGKGFRSLALGLESGTVFHRILFMYIVMKNRLLDVKTFMSSQVKVKGSLEHGTIRGIKGGAIMCENISLNAAFLIIPRRISTLPPLCIPPRGFYLADLRPFQPPNANISILLNPPLSADFTSLRRPSYPLHLLSINPI